MLLIYLFSHPYIHCHSFRNQVYELNMDEKHSSGRKLSGEKQKKPLKKRRKAKHKDREVERKRVPGKLLMPGFKSSSPDETNSDSALDFGKHYRMLKCFQNNAFSFSFDLYVIILIIKWPLIVI